MIERTDQLDVV